MIALDTNVLVRTVVEDLTALDQSRRARKLVEEVIARGDTIFLADIVLCEFVWVLRRAYKVSKAEIVRVLESILSTEQFDFESLETLRLAVDKFATSSADFADHLICELAKSHGCEVTYTFDVKLAQLDDVSQP